MDQFGVFTESFGLKPQGKSAPMAASKRQASSNEPKSTSAASWSSSSLNGSDPIAQSYGGAGGGYDDLFGKLSNQSASKSSFDYDSFFGGSNTLGSKNSRVSGYDNDDIFGGLNSSASARKDDVFASLASNNTASGDLLGNFGPTGAQSNMGSSRNGDDLLGNFGGMGTQYDKSWSSSRNGDDLLGNFDAQSKTSNPSGANAAGLNDWIDGFGGSNPSKNGVNMQTSQPRQSTNTTFMKSDDPFVVLESTSTSTYSSPELFSDPLQENNHFNFNGGTKPKVSSNASPILRPPPKPSQVVKPDKVKSSFVSPIDELEDFAMGGPGNSYSKEKLNTPAVSRKANNVGTGTRERQNANQEKGEGDLESFFSMANRSRSVPKSRNSTSVPNRREPEPAQRAFSGYSSGMKKVSSATNLVDDLSSVFGASPIVGEFEEVDGESEERRRSRIGRLKRTEERAAKALADMTRRDLQTQRENDERCRIAQSVDLDIKRWAAGKENNMRALLSSLHLVLWPECGWQPVSLTDMITSTSVKKVYRKATLCIHPDKVQQKGATLQQKYTAEKVFDILKEAWNKFNKEELS